MKKKFAALIVVLLTIGNLTLAINNEKKEISIKSKGDKNEKTIHPKVQPKVQFIKMDGSDGKDIVEVASASKDHKSLVKAVIAAGLVETLTGPGPYTIFAPTDNAFGKVPKDVLASLFKPENKEKLKSLLEHHAAAPAYNIQTLAQLENVDMVDGPKLKVNLGADGKVFVDDVEIKAAIKAKNGIIYVVDSVLVPK